MAVVIDNRKWAYLGVNRKGRVVPLLGKPDPYVIKIGSGYRQRRGDPTLDELAVARQYAGNIDILPGRSGLGNYVPPTVAKTIAPRITFSARGAALQWPPAPEEDILGYHIDRSHDTPGHPLDSFLRVTPSPINRVTHQDLWAFEGESVSYRIYTVRSDGTLSLRAQLSGVQTPFTDKPITGTFIVDASNTTAGKVTVFRGLHFRPGERVRAVHVKTSNPVLFVDCTALTSEHAFYADGGANIAVENTLIQGKVPATKDRSAGFGIIGDYLRSIRVTRVLFRGISGMSFGQFRGPTLAQGGKPTEITGNFFDNIHRKRSDGAGGTLAARTIAASYVEGSIRGQSNPTRTGGFTLPIGWDLANCLNVNNESNKGNNLPAAFSGGLTFRANACVQTPGKGLMEDAFSIFRSGGESWAAPYLVDLWCNWGNYGNGINHLGQVWQPGMPWPMGGQMQPPDNYIPGAPKPAGDYRTNYQSMTGGLMSDGNADTSSYRNNGAYVRVQRLWLMGPGVEVGGQHSHNQIVDRAKVVYTGFDKTGAIPITGGPRTGVYHYNFDGTKTAEGRLISHSRGIQNAHTIMPTKWPQGFDPVNCDPALTFGNTAVNRLATRLEEQAAWEEFLKACEDEGFLLGPQFPPPAVVYS